MKKKLKTVEVYEFLRDEFHYQNLELLNVRLKRVQTSKIEHTYGNKFEVITHIPHKEFKCVVMEFFDEFLDRLLTENDIVIDRLNVKEDKENG
jgi:putative IMPACT (imprinted ancient) family translation regulator